MLWRKSYPASTNATPFWRQSDLARRRSQVLIDLKSAVEASRLGEVSAHIDRALYLDDIVAAVAPRVRQVVSPSAPVSARDAVNLYQIGSLFLSECHEFLLRSSRKAGFGEESEAVALVSGTRIGAIRTWDRLIETPVSFSSKVGAAVDAHALSACLRRLDQFGYALCGVIHLHLHHGPPRPSSTDVALSKKLESGGYPVIQAVFSESGHVRFFSDQREFEVMLYGNGVEKLDHRLFRVATPAARTPSR